MIILLILLILFFILFFNNKGVPIFLYHQVNYLSNVNPILFEKHLKILKSKNLNTLTISEYYNYSHSKIKNSVLITLDDGYYDNYLYVFPLLKKYNMKATIFLNTFYIKERRNSKKFRIEPNNVANDKAIKKFLGCGSAKSYQYLSWEEIKEMSNSGLVDFQAHSHKHMAIFKNDKLEGIFNNNENDYTDSFLYKEIKKGYPKFQKRGEYSGPGILINPKFFKLFQVFYQENLVGKNKKEVLKLGNTFINKHKKEYFFYEPLETAQERIKKDFLTNKNLIESHINQEILFFCWPWGHRSNETIDLLKTLGIKGFITTKKGTNSFCPNWDLIKRIELRKFTPFKFKLNLFINRNLFLGKIYEWLS